VIALGHLGWEGGRMAAGRDEHRRGAGGVVIGRLGPGRFGGGGWRRGCFGGRRMGIKNTGVGERGFGRAELWKGVGDD